MEGRVQFKKNTSMKVHFSLIGVASLATIALLMSGCASSVRKTDGGAVGQVIRDSNTVDGGTVPYLANVKPSQRQGVVGVVQLEVQGKKLKSNRFDYPVVVNPAVEHWITYFTGKGHKYFAKYLERGRYFIPEISKVLKTHNMPQDLVYLAMIESGFNNSARSHAKAVGPWQFIRQTGQRYGLTVDYWLDERRDTRKATLAAIQYLKELYEEFGSWELAAAGYNSGENKVRRAIGKYKTHDFWEIARHKFFKRETRDYVPKIMAAAILTKNPELFGFNDPFKGGKVRNPTILADAGDDEESEEPTPKELGEPVAKSDETPDDPSEKVASNEKSGSEEEAEEEEDLHAMVSSSPTATMTPSVYMVANPNEQIIEFEVKGPADLFAISKASGLPYSTIKMLNPEVMRWCTPPYMKTYKIKLPLSAKERFLATYNDESFDRKVVFMRYTVRHGDTVSKVASRFGVEPAPIREINSFGLKRNDLRVGAAINLPVPTGYKRVIASMYDEKPSLSKKKRRRARRQRFRLRHDSAAVGTKHQRLRPSLARGDSGRSTASRQ